MKTEKIFERYGLTQVINASGTETVKGAAPVCPEALDAVRALVPYSVDMLELQSLACRTIAAVFETEGGLVVNCSSAGIAMAVAACMTGDDPARVERLPDTAGLKNEVIVQRGHNVNFGGYIYQNIALTGAKVIEIGAATECGAYALAGAITAQTAAALYVVSHHAVQSGLIDLATYCRICREKNVPVIVDGAAEPEPRAFLRAGADLVITSMHKRFESLTGGTVAGRLDLVRACLYQEKGIGRPMKVGKEAVIASIAALERWSALDRKKIAAAVDARLARGNKRLGRLAGLTVAIELDSSSRQFSRLSIGVDPAKAGLTASELAAALGAERPSIFVRSLMADIGILQLDLRLVSEEATDHILERIEALVSRAAGAGRGRTAAPAPAPNSADQGWARLQKFPLPSGAGRSAR